MKLNILLRTSEYRGDHSADVARAFDPKPEETVEQLVKRVEMNKGCRPDAYTDVLEIRLMPEERP